ncbi:MAG TPA: biliverdin-producing heme oxygenase [Mucilaginibacter sp.]|nr:biliverdin-producing heme oxygenase [Mucilaginibacter sp.]
MTSYLFSDRLKSETLSNHQQLEKLLVNRIRQIRNAGDYLVLLQLFYAYFARLEELLDQHLDRTKIPDYDKRRKADTLLRDIRSLNGEPWEMNERLDLPAISNHAQGLGAMYVFEGSTLGGSVIVGMLNKQLKIDNGACFNYFGGYGADNQAMWQEFKTLLNQQMFTHTDAAEMVASANQTFSGLENWLKRND